MIDYKYPTIASGATPIGRADSRTRRFQEVEELKKSKISRSRRIEEVEDLKFWRLNPSLQLELSLGGY
jgi:hypothetical protein